MLDTNSREHGLYEVGGRKSMDPKRNKAANPRAANAHQCGHKKAEAP
jgi:hypothetical protein